jgi:hypothetical protein
VIVRDCFAHAHERALSGSGNTDYE